MNKIRLLLIVILAMGAFNLYAGDKNSIEVTDVAMPKVPSVSPTAAIYLTITNNGKSSVSLIDASTSIAHHTMIHLSKVENGIAKMKHVESLEIKPGGRLEFVPGGYHIMLMGVDKTMITEPFEVTLKFEHGESVSFKVTSG